MRLAVDGHSTSALAEVRILGGVHGVDHAQLVGVDEVVHHFHFVKVKRLGGEGTLPGKSVLVHLHAEIHRGRAAQRIFATVGCIQKPSRLLNNKHHIVK